ncbi:MAG: class I tRNA ligase family protein, partial [Gemmatimonadales bacterium]
GKDITRFHSIIWPAMLMAAGLELPKMVWAHGFVLLAGDRFSKSAGVRLELDDAIDRYGVDAFRYFLLREVPFDADGNFSWERFEERYNADLANAWGNLASRVISMIDRYREGVIPAGRDEPTDAADAADFAAYHASLDGSTGYLHHEALKALWRTIARANEFVDRQAPWKLAKDENQAAELDRTLGSLAHQLMRQTVYAAPFMPNTAQELWTRLGAPGSVHDQRFESLYPMDPSGWKVAKGPPLFPKEAITKA